MGGLASMHVWVIASRHFKSRHGSVWRSPWAFAVDDRSCLHVHIRELAVLRDGGWPWPWGWDRHCISSMRGKRWRTCDNYLLHSPARAGSRKNHSAGMSDRLHIDNRRSRTGLPATVTVRFEVNDMDTPRCLDLCNTNSNAHWSCSTSLLAHPWLSLLA
jgi:hypothetical protein